MVCRNIHKQFAKTRIRAWDYNLMPIDGLDSIPKPFKQAVIEWEFSGDWVHYDSLEDYEAELAERGEESI